MIAASIAGASGYAGGELLRLLLDHPQVTVAQATSERYAGKFVHTVHPNLRGQTRLAFSRMDDLTGCDLLFVALPHGRAARQIAHFAGLAERIVDLSADFRLRDPVDYERWYGSAHPAPDWLARFVYGLPEANRESIRSAGYVSGVGCNATASNLALLPLVRAGLVDESRPLIVDLKVGSSEGGNKPGLASHHPERNGVVRSFAPTGHRHTAEVRQVTGLPDVHLSVTAVEMVRGVLATAHVWPSRALSERDLWRAFRQAYNDEPFVRIIHERGGIHRHPEPKIVTGSNYADVGFALDESSGRVVALCALDNLMKGAAGTAVQCMNLMMDWPETEGLEFPGLHPL